VRNARILYVLSQEETMTQERLKGPYAPPAAVFAVLHRMRERGLPEQVDYNTLGAVGVAEGNQSRTLVALKFLGLVSENDRRTELFDRLGRATSEEYPQLLDEVLRAAYAPVFTLVDPARDDEGRIFDAFRRYEPGAQRSRMVTLFMALCREAGIVPASATQQRSTATRRREPQPRRVAPQASRRNESAKPPPLDPEAVVDLRPIHQMVDALPPEGWWTEERRRRWFRALEGSVDYAIDVREEAPAVALNGGSSDVSQ
jgi:hypothetical protein